MSENTGYWDLVVSSVYIKRFVISILLCSYKAPCNSVLVSSLVMEVPRSTWCLCGSASLWERCRRLSEVGLYDAHGSSAYAPGG